MRLPVTSSDRSPLGVTLIGMLDLPSLLSLSPLRVCSCLLFFFFGCCLQTLAAYDSDEWGELEEDDERVQGQW